MNKLRNAWLGAALVAIAPWTPVLGGNGATSPSRSAVAAPAIIDLPVTFDVVNRNGSLVVCPSDGEAHVIHGHLVGPRALLTGPSSPSGTLYLHGLGFAGWYWHFGDVPGYDFARSLAAQGHVSILIDRLGHGDSTLANGNSVCIGSNADMADQIIGELKSGTYARADGGSSVAFGRIAIAGHSAGGGIAEVAAYSFHGADALIVMDWIDSGTSLFSIRTLVASTASCLTTAGGYASFGRTDADFDRAMFHDTDPRVVATVTAMRARDPCGDLESLATTLAVNQVGISLITVPVLLVCASDDALFPSSACGLQALRYLNAENLTVFRLADTGHAAMLERSAPDSRRRLSGWLVDHGF